MMVTMEKELEQTGKVLPEGWKWVKLGDICDFIGGMQPPKSTFSNRLLPGYVRLVQIQDFRRSDMAVYIPEEEAKRRFDESDVMIGRYGPPVFQILRGLSGAYNVALMKTAPKPCITKDYLYYLLQEYSIQKAVISQSQRSAGQSGVQRQFLEELTVPLPPLTEQKRIVAILNEKMAAIEKARTATLAQIEAAKALPAAYLRQVFDSPEAQTWERKTLEELCKENGQYGTSEKSNRLGLGLPVLGMGNIVNGSLHWENLSFIQLEKSQQEKYLLKKGDLLFNRTNSAELVGKTAVFDGVRDAVFASYLIRFRLKENLANSHFITAYINSSIGRKFIEENMGRSIGQVNISASTMNTMIIPIPSLEKQNEISLELIEKRNKVKFLQQSLQEQLEAINALPAAILKQAFNGEL